MITQTKEVKGASVVLHQRVMRGDDLLVEAHVKVAFVSGGRARPIPKPLRIAMRADYDAIGSLTPASLRPRRRPAASHVKTIHMSWSKDHKGGPRGYHHGNLKEALVRAALALIAEKGPAGFTFADAARWAGVSPAAPYRHFRDRDELLSDVARRGFDQFEATLARGWNDGRPAGFAAFERLGKAYLEFARNEPAYYSAMFEAGIPLDSDPQLRQAGERAFAVLRTASERLIAEMPARQTAARADDGIARLGAVARHRLSVRPRRCRTALAADVGGGIAGGRCPHLPPRARLSEALPRRIVPVLDAGPLTGMSPT